METFLLFSSVSLLILLSISIYFNIKHAIIILNIQDSIEKSLDILDIQYSNMSKIADTPVFFDSVEVRGVISQIKKSQDSVLAVATTLTSGINREVKDDD